MRFPKTVKEAYDTDRQSGTDFCTKAVEKEMTNVRISFEKLDDVSTDMMRKGETEPGYEPVNVHMIFHINMDGEFTRKARLVADGHTIAPPSSIIYSSVVSVESVRISFLLASLNELDIFACDIGNACLNVKFRKKLWIEAGTDFGTIAIWT